MIDTNTQNNSALISLSRAAQLTGYHQDYLGQLCRLGKLSAIKVGRNWFTFPEALDKLSVSFPDVVEENFVETTEAVEAVEVSEAAPEQEAQEASFEFEQPKIIQNVTISQVEGLPISIRTIPTPARGVNNVQNILTTLRIESLQREVSELRQLLGTLMSEVAAHSSILSTRANTRLADSMKHSYVSNFDFNAPYSRRNLLTNDESVRVETPELNWRPMHEPRYSLVAIMSGAAVMVAVALLSYGIISGQFFGEPNPQVSTIYYQSPTLAQDPYTVLSPTVAGDTLPPENLEQIR